MAMYNYKRRRVSYADGMWADVSEVCFPADRLRFEDVSHTDHTTRMLDIARLRYLKALARGEDNPVVILWDCGRPGDEMLSARRLIPGLDAITDSGEHLISARSLVTYTLRKLLDEGWLRKHRDNWTVDVPVQAGHWHQLASATISWLQQTRRLYCQVRPGQETNDLTFDNFRSSYNLIPVGSCGFARDYVQKTDPPAAVAFNTSFFLLEHDDFVSHHSALGDPHGLFVQSGIVKRPAIYRRSSIWQTEDGAWQVGQHALTDMRIRLPGMISYLSHDADAEYCFCLNPVSAEPIAIYTRYFGVAENGYVVGRTPDAVDRTEFTVVDNRIVGWKRGGGLLIPQNGFVISFTSGSMSEQIRRQILAQSTSIPLVEYTLDSQQRIRQAIHGGPLLLEDGKLALSDNSFRDEQFWISRQTQDGYMVGVVPTDYPLDTDRTRAGRVGPGIKANGDLVVIAVDGVNTGIGTEFDSAGATLVELAEQLASAGAVHAINLDGGGSTQIFVDGGLLTRPGDRRGQPNLVYERMVPSIGVVR